MPIRIIAIGKKHESWIAEGIERYQKRLKQPFNVDWVLLPHSSSDGPSARQDESQRILLRLNTHDYVVLLDEKGKMFDSPELSTTLQKQLNRSRPVTLIIGGAYGVDDTVHARSDIVWSLSHLVLPHQLVRLVIIEQVYRSQEIAIGGPYHHA